MPRTSTNDNQTTRIIPGLKSAYQIVSLPYWAWFWLEDFMKKNHISYHGIYQTFGGTTADIGQTLQQIAELHHEYAMREVYNLANDNEPSDEILSATIKKRTKRKLQSKEPRLPRIYKIFGFMPCATSLEAVWERRNYNNHNRIL